MSSKYYRKDLFCSVYSKSGELFQFAVKLKNTPGALAEVASFLFSKGVNILHGFHSAFPDEKEAVWGFFADLRGLTDGVENLVKEMESLDSTLEVKFSRPIIDGLIVDTLHFPIIVLDERSLVLKIKTLAESFNRLYEKFGSGAGFMLLQATYSLLALQMDNEDLKLIVFSPLFVVGYKEIRNFIKIKSFLDVFLLRREMRWGRIKRLGIKREIKSKNIGGASSALE